MQDVLTLEGRNTPEVTMSAEGL